MAEVAGAQSIRIGTDESLAATVAARLEEEFELCLTSAEAALGYRRSSVQAVSAWSEDGLSAVMVGEPRWGSALQRASGPAADDAATLCAGYREFGDAVATHMRGRFAFALFDAARQRTLLAIDRMGIEQMYYSTEGGLAYGTALRRVRTTQPLSKQALFNYLYFNVVPSPETIYSGIRKLEPGQLLAFEGDQAMLSFYWTPSHEQDDSTSEEELGKQLHETLRNAISYCSIDAATGAFLSGGLDSSTVVGFASDAVDGEFNAYTVGFSQEGYDEVEYARIAASHFGVTINEYYVTPQNIADEVQTIATAYDEPFGNSSAIPTLFCARLAAGQGKTHLLAGDGGDELFAGNERYATQSVFELYHRVPKILRRALLEPLFLKLPSDWNPLSRKGRRYIEQALVRLPERLQTYNFLHMNDCHEVFDANFMTQIDPNDPIRQMEDWYARSAGADVLTRMLFFDWKLTLADNDIRKVNTMCAEAGVRVSYPMMDDDLTEFSARVPSRLKLRSHYLRRFYKRAMSNYLPQHTLSKTKHGFGLPFGEWLKTSDELRARMLPSIEQLKERNIVSARFLDDLRHKHENEHAAYYGNILWILMMLEIWLQENA